MESCGGSRSGGFIRLGIGGIRWGWRWLLCLLGSLLRLIVSGLLRLGLIGHTLLGTTSTGCPNDPSNQQYGEDHHHPHHAGVATMSFPAHFRAEMTVLLVAWVMQMCRAAHLPERRLRRTFVDASGVPLCNALAHNLTNHCSPVCASLPAS